MTRKRTVQSILVSCMCLAGFTTSMANSDKTDCDVVTLAGSGTQLQNRVIVGNETLTVLATGEQIPVEFVAVPLGAIEFDAGKVTFISSHDFKGVDDRKIRFTTFDKITTVPLEGDPSCATGACGLVFQLELETGSGRYNCGEIVSGYDETFTAFTSTLQGGTLELNSMGKLCKCRRSGNN